MNQKTILVTGATSGIGKVTALELARAGHQVLLTSRDPAKGKRVLEEIRSATNNQNLELYVGDFSSMADVRRIALEVRAKHPKLDVLLNNAGSVFIDRKLTVDGFEQTLAVNHLAPFLLTNLLLEPLKAGKARVVNVASNANNAGKIRWNDLHFKTGYMSFLVYAQSKLMNIVFSNELSKRLHGTGVTSNALHPGVVRSNFWDTNNIMMRVIFGIIQRLGSITPEEAAKTTLFLATSSSVEGMTGKYFVENKAHKSNPIADDETAQKRLWEVSEGLVSKWLTAA
jgi:NAD(P)-dependent dehydrogenase (short-subunit alcohol dehydrogenase family)